MNKIHFSLVYFHFIGAIGDRWGSEPFPTSKVGNGRKKSLRNTALEPTNPAENTFSEHESNSVVFTLRYLIEFGGGIFLKHPEYMNILLKQCRR